EWGDIIWAGIGGVGQGLAAWADGFIPFVDPFDSFYDPADETLQWSVFFGGVSRDALLAAAIPNLGAWLRNPAMYEMGSMTIPVRLFNSLAHLTPVARGQAIFRQLGWGGFGLGRLATAADWAATYNTGGTPGARLLLVGLLHGADYVWEEFLQN
ncbi:MAG: hypothetical protein GY826_11950, partial [Fuerstiella sp.]|nr:hypothetical protein [Fuerstiella sp.]